MRISLNVGDIVIKIPKEKEFTSDAQPNVFKTSVVTLCQSEGTDQFVIALSPPVVACLLKKGLHNGGIRAPQDLPGYVRLFVYCL